MHPFPDACVHALHVCSTLPFFLSISFCDLFYIDYTALHRAEQWFPGKVLFVPVLILTCPSITALPCGISLSPGRCTAISSLPVGRRVSAGSRCALVGAKCQRSAAASCSFAITSTLRQILNFVGTRHRGRPNTTWRNDYNRHRCLFLKNSYMFSVSLLFLHIWVPVTFLASWLSAVLFVRGVAYKFMGSYGVGYYHV